MDEKEQRGQDAAFARLAFWIGAILGLGVVLFLLVQAIQSAMQSVC